MIFDILTIFPDLFTSPLNEGILRKARQEGKIRITVTDIRDFADDRHATTDDRPFGGGEGMVMKAEPLAAAVEQTRRSGNTGRVVLLTPQGRRYSQAIARELAKEDSLVLVCGRYEGVDERFRAAFCDDEISIGDRYRQDVMAERQEIKQQIAFQDRWGAAAEKDRGQGALHPGIGYPTQLFFQGLDIARHIFREVGVGDK
jgi:hypothetical protein